MMAKELKQNKASEDALSLPQADKNQNSDFKKNTSAVPTLSFDRPPAQGREKESRGPH